MLFSTLACEKAGEGATAAASTWLLMQGGTCLDAAPGCDGGAGDELRAAGYCTGGILTPGSAGGTVLIQRLRDAGMTFQVRS